MKNKKYKKVTVMIPQIGSTAFPPLTNEPVCHPQPIMMFKPVFDEDRYERWLEALNTRLWRKSKRLKKPAR